MTITNLDAYPAGFVAPKDFANYLVVSQRTVYHWIDKGALYAVRIEGVVRIPIDEARRFARVQPTAAGV